MLAINDRYRYEPKKNRWWNRRNIQTGLGGLVGVVGAAALAKHFGAELPENLRPENIHHKLQQYYGPWARYTGWANELPQRKVIIDPVPVVDKGFAGFARNNPGRLGAGAAALAGSLGGIGALMRMRRGLDESMRGLGENVRAW
jgi:hypothetical protein